MVCDKPTLCCDSRHYSDHKLQMGLRGIWGKRQKGSNVKCELQLNGKHIKYKTIVMDIEPFIFFILK